MLSGLLEITIGKHAVRATLKPDPEGSELALAHGFGFAFSYQSTELPPMVREIVLALGKEFTSAGRHEKGRDLREVVQWLSGALSRLVKGDTAVALTASLFPDQHVPRFSQSARNGFPAGLNLIPCDHELIGLLEENRSLIKRETFSQAEFDASYAWLERWGLHLKAWESPDNALSRVIFAARGEAYIRRALDAETALVKSRGQDLECLAELGGLLGYPPCCVEAFMAQRAHDDLSMAVSWVAGNSGESLSPKMSHLIGPLSLYSHTPCSGRCEATSGLVADLLDSVGTYADAGYAARWDEATRAIHAWGRDGACFLIYPKGLSGRLAEERSVKVVEVVESQERGGVELLSRPELSERLLSISDGILKIEDSEGVLVESTLWADHRGIDL